MAARHRVSGSSIPLIRGRPRGLAAAPEIQQLPLECVGSPYTSERPLQELQEPRRRRGRRVQAQPALDPGAQARPQELRDLLHLALADTAYQHMFADRVRLVAG